MSTNRTVNVFIASAGDIIIERKIVTEVCLGLNESDMFTHSGVSLQARLWEDVIPSSEHAREVISNRIEECDIFVCIIYKRLDIPLSRRETGTLNEFLSVCDSGKLLKKPHFMFYFKSADISSMNDHTDPHVNQVHVVKEKIQKDTLMHSDEFSAPHEFCEKIYDHLESWAREHVMKQL